MRRVLTFLGGIFRLLLVAFGTLAIWSNSYAPEATSYLENSIRDIAKDWNQKELLKRATPDLLQGGGPDQLTAMFSALSPLGPLKSIESSTGGTGFGYKPDLGHYIYANYLTVAHFANGDATIRTGLLRHCGRKLWRR